MVPVTKCMGRIEMATFGIRFLERNFETSPKANSELRVPCPEKTRTYKFSGSGVWGSSPKIRDYRAYMAKRNQ